MGGRTKRCLLLAVLFAQLVVHIDGDKGTKTRPNIEFLVDYKRDFCARAASATQSIAKSGNDTKMVLKDALRGAVVSSVVL